MSFSTWLKTLPGSPTPTIAAKKSGLAAPTLLRHVERGYSTADNVIAIAKAYGVSPIDALVDNEMLAISDLGHERSPIKAALRKATITELLETLIERVNSSGLVEGHFEMSDITGGYGLHDTVRDEDLSPDDGWQYEEMAAADDSPDEPMLGDDGYHDGP